MFTWQKVIYVFFILAGSDASVHDYNDGCSLLYESNMCTNPEECIKKNMVIFRDRCLLKCPEWTHFFEEHTQTCYAECPQDTVVSEVSCLRPTTCIKKNQLFFNRTCVAFCPKHSPFTRDGKCYSECPAKTISKGTMCIDPSQCTKIGYYIFNTTCLNSCPRNTSFVKYGTCLDTCPPDTVRNGKSCIYNADCIKLYKVVYNGTCLDMCPAEAPYNVSGECYAHCPQGYVLNDMICISVSDCTKTKIKVIFNGTCVFKCPFEAPLLDDDDKTCFNKCPDQTVKYETSCISVKACTDITQYYKLVFNGTCMDTCPKATRFMHDRHCLVKCPTDLFADGNECITKYQCESKGVSYADKCMKSCPSEAPIQNNKECVKSCPENTVNDNNTCIYNYHCNNMKKLLFNGSCVRECPQKAPFQHSGNCLVRCPSSSDYIFSISYSSSGSESYGKSDYMIGINGTNCIDIVNCVANGQVVYNQTCVRTCPPGTSITYMSNRSPWNSICYSLDMKWLYALLFSSFFLLCLLVFILLLYNQKTTTLEKEQGLSVKKPNPQGEGDEEEPHSSLDAVEADREAEEQHRVNMDDAEDFEGEEPVFYQPNHRLGTEITTNVDVHNDFPLYDDDIPLLPMDRDNFGHNSDNSDEDDALLFGCGHGYGN